MTADQTKPILGVSSCLLGNEVRYDGGHKHNAYIMRTLSSHFDFRSFCPETEIGLPTPRPPVHLISSDGDEPLRAVEVRDHSVDYTEQLRSHGRKISQAIDDLSGYIVKKDSPSCGMERVKVYEREGAPPVRRGSGIYIDELMKQRPELPVEEEGRLMDPRLRENFVTRVFTMHRWLQMNLAGLSNQALIEFHTRHKFLLLSHDESIYRELGRLVAQVGKTELEQMAKEYLGLLMTGLRKIATPGKHANVLMHIMGFVKDHLESDEKAELLDLIDAHRNEMVPVIVPITLLNHFLRKYPHDYALDQYYLAPHPRELMLRNSI